MEKINYDILNKIQNIKNENYYSKRSFPRNISSDFLYKITLKNISFYINNRTLLDDEKNLLVYVTTHKVTFIKSINNPLIIKYLEKYHSNNINTIIVNEDIEKEILNYKFNNNINKSDFITHIINKNNDITRNLQELESNQPITS